MDSRNEMCWKTMFARYIHVVRYTAPNGQRCPKAAIGAWQPLLRTPTADRERLPKKAAGRAG